MKKYVKSAHYTLYDGKQIRVEDGETTSQAIARYKAQVAKDTADREEANRIAKEEKALAKAERRRTPRYKDGDVVVTKDGKCYQLYDGYYMESDDTVYYSAVPCKNDGAWDIPDEYDDYRWSEFGNSELDQRDIQKRLIKASKYVRSSTYDDDDDDDFSLMHNSKYIVSGGPHGDYVGDYDESLAEYYGQKQYDSRYFNSPKQAIAEWFKVESKYPIDAAIETNKDAYARELCQWVVDHENEFRQMYDRSNCHYKYDYLFDGAVEYATKTQIYDSEYPDQIFPFCYG